MARYHGTIDHYEHFGDVFHRGPNLLDDRPCANDDCRRDHVNVLDAADQRTRDRAIYLATIRAANVYDGRPRTVPVTLDNIIADAEHLLSGWADADSRRVRDGGTPTA